MSKLTEIFQAVFDILAKPTDTDNTDKNKIESLERDVKYKTDLIHEFRATLTSIRDCPYSNVKQYHINQIDSLLSRKFKG